MPDDERFIDLESKIAYLENFISELNSVVIEQEQSIKHLMEEVEMLKRDIKESKESLPDREKPPHY